MVRVWLGWGQGKRPTTHHLPTYLPLVSQHIVVLHLTAHPLAVLEVGGGVDTADTAVGVVGRI